MDFIKNTSPKYIQVRFLAQKNAQKRAPNVQEEETTLSTKECQLALWKCRSAQVVNRAQMQLVQV